MKKMLLGLSLLYFAMAAPAQSIDAGRGITASYLYEASEKYFIDKNYPAALGALGKATAASDSLLYLRIKILENLYATSYAYTADLDSSLRLFSRKANRYSFPEMKYAEVGRINTGFQDFKNRDRQFYDSVLAVSDLKRSAELPAISNRLHAYLKTTPNSFYNTELQALGLRIGTELARLQKIRQQAIADSTYRVKLKRMGKGTFINIGYALPSGTLGNRFAGMRNYFDVRDFFNGRYQGGLGVKYSLNASLFNAFINVYRSTRIKASIDWNILDAEYTLFDWSGDTLLRKESGYSTEKATELKSIKVGTRVGPSITIMLTRKLAASLYYSARPGMQFVLSNEHYFTVYKTSGEENYTLTNDLMNYNLSHELGVKFRFIKTLYLNPFYHFGYFTWKHELFSDNGGSELLKANYKFGLMGLRIGL